MSGFDLSVSGCVDSPRPVLPREVAPPCCEAAPPAEPPTASRLWSEITKSILGFLLVSILSNPSR